MFDKIEARIAQLLVTAAQAAPDDPGAALAAAMIWAVQRVTYAVGSAAIDRGEPVDHVRRRQRDAIDRGFAQDHRRPGRHAVRADGPATWRPALLIARSAVAPLRVAALAAIATENRGSPFTRRHVRERDRPAEQRALLEARE